MMRNITKNPGLQAGAGPMGAQTAVLRRGLGGDASDGEAGGRTTARGGPSFSAEQVRQVLENANAS